MAKMEIPDSLVGVKEASISDKSSNHPLLFFDDPPSDSLYIWSSYSLNGNLLRVGANRFNNLDWWIRKYFKRENSLWGAFSEELIKNKIKDKKGELYGVHCDQSFATLSRGINLDESYFLMNQDEKKAREAFYFAASELLRRLDSIGFPKNEVKKLRNFFYEDFTTRKYAKESIKMGQEADSVFFNSISCSHIQD